jgi:hypothetical protein
LGFGESYNIHLLTRLGFRVNASIRMKVVGDGAGWKRHYYFRGMRIGLTGGGSFDCFGTRRRGYRGMRVHKEGALGFGISYKNSSKSFRRTDHPGEQSDDFRGIFQKCLWLICGVGCNTSGLASRSHAIRRPPCRSRLSVQLTVRPDGRLMLVLSEERVGASSKRLEELGLTSREAEVLHWLCEGKTNPEIA